MTRTKNIITKAEILSSLFMLFALLWLTISLPFVNYAQQVLDEQVSGGIENNSSQQNIPTEEKTESGNNSLSEYLHDNHLVLNHGNLINKGYKIDPDDTYLAFHPEMVILPPEA